MQGITKQGREKKKKKKKKRTFIRNVSNATSLSLS
jgi:hypothetical protein